MKHPTLLLVIFLLAAIVPCAGQQFEWAMQSYDKYATYGGVAAIDSNGNLYLCATFSDTTFFAGHLFTAKPMQQGSGPHTGAFFAKMAPDGECLWATGMRSDRLVSIAGIAVDRENNCWVAGFFERNIEFAGGTVLTGGFDPRSYLARYDSRGNLLWARSYGNDVSILSLRFNPQGTLVATGAISPFRRGTLDSFDLGFGGSGYYGSFVACFDTAGTILWGRNVASSGSQLTAHNSGIDSSGNIYLCGLVRGTVDFGNNYRFTVEGLNDRYIAKLKSDGSLIWATVDSGEQDQSGDAIAVEENGTFYIVADVRGPASFGSYRIMPGDTSTPYDTDVAIAKFDADGNCLWARLEGGRGNNHGRSIALDGRGRIWVSGISDSVNLGLYQADTAKHRGWGLFVAAYDTEDGTPQWLYSLPAAHGSVIAWRGGCYVSGGFYGEAEIAETKLKSTKDGYYDLMLAKIGFGGGE